MIKTQLRMTLFSVHVTDQISSTVTDESRFGDLPEECRAIFLFGSFCCLSFGGTGALSFGRGGPSLLDLVWRARGPFICRALVIDLVWRAQALPFGGPSLLYLVWRAQGPSISRAL